MLATLQLGHSVLAVMYGCRLRVTYLRQKCHLASSVSYSAAIQHAVAQNQHQTSISFPSCVNLWDFIAPTQYIPRGNSSIKGEKAHYWEAGESKIVR